MASGTITNIYPASGYDSNTGIGYCKFPDGTLYMYGANTIAVGDAYKTINFPVSFSSAARYGFSATANYGSTNQVILTLAAVGTSSINVHRNTATTGEQNFRWTAIGRWK